MVVWSVVAHAELSQEEADCSVPDAPRGVAVFNLVLVILEGVLH